MGLFSNLSDGAMWSIFGIAVVILLAWDLFFLNRKNEVPAFSHTLLLCLVYIAAGLLFGVFVMYEHGTDDGMLFFTGFLVEKSLSLDNIFVMSVVFSSLGIPRIYQHRVLFWGILGAIVMRALLIWTGEALIERFHWVLYVFSFFLFYTGIKMVVSKDDEGETKLEESRLYKVLSRFFHITTIHSGHFFVKENGRHYITPLFFALMIIEIMDVIFALDSIPAIFLITQNIFIVYTSNIFAILGLRALYFLLEAAVHKFYYLKPALSVIMIFIGAKIFMPHLIGWEVSSMQSLIITFGVIFAGITASLLRKSPNEKA
ncbi:MAG: TerC/Alx family metal homeostasis membrane protein [Alphaproteobacteria bacterium]|nr:TerC/Alx family metal homeostasis membrane protein [Alphaproteobacteria bacterium]MBR1600228.1 TerC/Alx family metal homeostasis membrane protein [Alphaproteobacteria bacterium]